MECEERALQLSLIRDLWNAQLEGTSEISILGLSVCSLSTRYKKRLDSLCSHPSSLLLLYSLHSFFFFLFSFIRSYVTKLAFKSALPPRLAFNSQSARLSLSRARTIKHASMPKLDNIFYVSSFQNLHNIPFLDIFHIESGLEKETGSLTLLQFPTIQYAGLWSFISCL